MIERNKGRDRRRKRQTARLGSIIGLSAVVLCVFGLVFLNRVKEKKEAGAEVQASENTASASLQMAEETSPETEAETKSASLPAAVGALQATETIKAETASEVQQTVKGPAQGPPPAATVTTVPATEAESVPAAAEKNGAENGFLKNFDAYKPGDLLPEEKIDRNRLDQYFVIYEISRQGKVFSRINGKSYRENDNISLSDLRYLQMPHYNFDGKVQLGEMIVHKDIADEVVAIFKELFLSRYQIDKMYLIDNYWTGDGGESDSNSIDHNNTSAFCYRTGTGSSSLSKHAFGLAIDINPQQNPYVSYSTGEPKWSHANANDYIARDTGYPHVITHEDLAFQLFQKYGFTWGGDWTNPRDYQHFEMR